LWYDTADSFASKLCQWKRGFTERKKFCIIGQWKEGKQELATISTHFVR